MSEKSKNSTGTVIVLIIIFVIGLLGYSYYQYSEMIASENRASDRANQRSGNVD